MTELRGIQVSNKIKEEVKEKILNSKKIPKLAIIRVGEKPDDISYEKGAVKKMENFGIETERFIYGESISNDDFIKEFNKINDDKNIDGILLLRPLPSHIDEKYIEKLIDKKKDIDGISPLNVFETMRGSNDGFAPCTAMAVMEMLKTYDVSLAGKKVVVLGRSMVVGKPLSMLMLNENATVTVCHSKTDNLKEECKAADILVVAIGKAKFVDNSFIKTGAVVIDVGINIDDSGNLCGDVDFDSVKSKASMLSPVPGGVGTVTTAVLAKNLIKNI